MSYYYDESGCGRCCGGYPSNCSGSQRCQYCCITGPTGATGPAGPGGNAESACCGCVDQMRNIIQQIIALYPENNLFITLDSGDAIVGPPGSLIAGPNGIPGVFAITFPQVGNQQLITLCSIGSIRVDAAVYNEAITYLPAPVPVPTGCCEDCESTIRSLLPVGTSGISIITSEQFPAQGTVIRNEYGMIVLENTASNDITFVSSCKIDYVDRTTV